MASILAIYDIRKPVDDQGKEFDPDIKFGDGVVRWVPSTEISLYPKCLDSHPEPFKVQILPRSESAMKLIREARSEFRE